MINLSKTTLTQVIKHRPALSHKGTFGRVVLIGGNEQYGGAIIMAAEAVVKAGTGLTTVITAKKNHAPLHARLPEAMVIDWQQKQAIAQAVQAADVLLIGPGLGTDSIGRQLFVDILALQEAHQWLIVDGSALTLFSMEPFILPYPEQTVFTPHQQEWQRVSHLSVPEQTIQNNQEKRAALGVTVVLKGHRTEIYTTKDSYKNPLGTPAMATGGMGDTLAGIIAAFLAQFSEKEAAITAAVYLHSLIGEELAQKQYVVLPTQISEQLPYFMKRFEQKTR